MADPPVLSSDRLAAVTGVRHAFFTRAGGVSKGLYASLNLGVGSADDPAAVAENRRRAAALFGAGPQALATCFQVHSNAVIIADAPFAVGPRDRPRADGVVSRARGLVCGALAADCAPVLMADGEARVVAAAHAGWRGALAGVVEAGVAAMVSLGATPERIVAIVGPCIGPASYEVGGEFLAAFIAADPSYEAFFAAGARPEKRLFDLPAFVLARLAAAGVRERAWIGADTYADEAAFFSNRRAVHRREPDYGRLLSAIMLE
ncbi:MAG TPA: peptidoglycan editing factor PgeF [Caulobacteraceae bacterium]